MEFLDDFDDILLEDDVAIANLFRAPYNSMNRSIRDLGYSSEKTKRNKDALADIMLNYLEMTSCRREFLLKYFEGNRNAHIESQPKENCCDNCTKKLSPFSNDIYVGVDSSGLYDIAIDAHKYLSAISVMEGKFGHGMYILFVRGSKSSKLYDKFQKHPLHGTGKDKSDDWWKSIGNILEREKYVNKIMNKRTGKFSFATFNLNAKGKKFLKEFKDKPNTVLKIQPSPEMLKLLKVNKYKELLQTSSKTVVNNSKKEIIRDSDGFIQTGTTTSQYLSQFAAVKKPQCTDEDKQKLYRLLLNTRTELAYQFDCMPYMIASNEVLMKLAEKKPRSLDELKNLQLNTFTEAKINKFGPDLIKTILFVSNVVPEENIPTIFDVLQANPIPDVKFGSSSETTYTLFKNGKSIQDIADERKLNTSTVSSHLIDAIKVGHPVKLRTFGVTSKIKSTIQEVLQKLSVDDDNPKLTSIKNLCPESITFDHIKAVKSYFSVRHHLSKLNLEYVDFEDIDDESLDFDNTNLDDKNLTGENASTVDVLDDFEENDRLNALVDAIEQGDYDIKSPKEPEAKKMRLSLLDSP